MENVRHITPRHGDEGDGGFERVPPQDLDAEQSVLGGMLLSNSVIPDVTAAMDPAEHYLPAHETIHRAILELRSRKEPADPITLTNELARTGDLKRVGGTPYLHTLVNAVPTAANAGYYAGIVHEKAARRRVVEAGMRIVQLGYAEDGDLATVTDLVRKHADEATTTGRPTGSVDALLAEMLTSSALDDMPALEPLIGDLLHLDSLARIVGPSGHMKSFVTIDMAGHVGTGLPWHGHYTRPGTVIYLVAEGARGIRKRVRAWEQAHGLVMDNVLFLPRPVQAMSPEWDTLIEACRRVSPALIVVDTQARVSVGVEENSAKELGLVVDRLEQLRAATAACVLVIHHTGHVGEHGRGSSSAKGALQSELHVSKKGDNARNIIVTIKTGKQKDDEETGDLQFGLRVVTIDGEAKPDGRPVTSVVLESLDRVDPATVQGTAEWLAARLDRAGVPVEYGVPRVRDLLPQMGIQASKARVEEAVRIRKTRGVQTIPGKSIPDTQSGFDDMQWDEPGQPDARNARNDIPCTAGEAPTTTPPHTQSGSPGEGSQNPSSDIPPTHQGAPGSGTPITSSPSPIPRNGEVGESPPVDPTASGPPAIAGETPTCAVCGRVMNREWADRGYDTHLSCDPSTGSHPDSA